MSASCAQQSPTQKRQDRSSIPPRRRFSHAICMAMAAAQEFEKWYFAPRRRGAEMTFALRLVAKSIMLSERLQPRFAA